MCQSANKTSENSTVSADSAYNRSWRERGNRVISQLAGMLRQAIDSKRAGNDLNTTFNRKPGYCSNCNSNVVHVRAFNSPVAYRLDRMSFSLLGLLNVGPWRCVDCGFRRLLVRRPRQWARVIAEESMANDDQAISNFLRTDKSLAHAAANSERFSEKFRFGIVDKLLAGTTTISQCCSDLHVSELEIQMWIRDFLQHQIEKAATNPAQPPTAALPDESDRANRGHGLTQFDDPGSGMVIESSVVRKSK